MRIRVLTACLALLTASPTLRADMFVDLPIADAADQLAANLPDLPAHNHPLWPCWEAKKGPTKTFWQPLVKPKEGEEDSGDHYSPTTDFSKEGDKWVMKSAGSTGRTQVTPVEPPARLDAVGTVALVDDFFVHLHPFHEFDHRIVAGLKPWYHRAHHDRLIQGLYFRSRFGYATRLTSECFLGLGSFPFKGLCEEVFAADTDPFLKLVRSHYLEGIDPLKKRGDMKWDDFYVKFLDDFTPPEKTPETWDDWLTQKILEDFSRDRLFNNETTFGYEFREAPERVLPLMVQLLSHPHPQIRWSAAGFLFDGGHPRLETLLTAVETHPDPVVSVRAWVWRRRLGTADEWVARGLRSRLPGRKARAIEQLGVVPQTEYRQHLLDILAEEVDMEPRVLAIRALLLDDKPPHKTIAACWESLKRDRAAQFLAEFHVLAANGDFKKTFKFVKEKVRDWLKRKDKQNVGLVRRNEDFDLMYRILWRQAAGDKKKEESIWKLFRPKSPDVNWEQRYTFIGSLLREQRKPDAALCAKELAGWLKHSKSLATSRKEAAEYFWGACTRLASLALAVEDDKARDKLARELFASESKALTDYNSEIQAAQAAANAVAAQDPDAAKGHVHKIKVRELRVLRHRHRLWDLARRHVAWNAKDLKTLLAGMDRYQKQPVWLMGWAKAIAVTAKPGDGKALTGMMRSLHEPRARRLALRNLIVLDGKSKSNRAFVLKLIKDRDPWTRFHAHRLLEEWTGQSFFFNPDDSKNSGAWTKAWNAAFKKK